MADGDGRALLNLVEQVAAHRGAPMDAAELAERLQRRAALYDKYRDGHYNLISALHKSVRGSDPDAALYWLARMLKGGEDPRFLARRITRMAVEDIGLADPPPWLCLDAWDDLRAPGLPRGRTRARRGRVYLASRARNRTPPTRPSPRRWPRPRDRLADAARAHPERADAADEDPRATASGYIYDHDTDEGFSGQDYFPTGMEREHFYRPGSRGLERELAERLLSLADERARKGGSGSS